MSLIQIAARNKRGIINMDNVTSVDFNFTEGLVEFHCLDGRFIAVDGLNVEQLNSIEAQVMQCKQPTYKEKKHA